MYFKKSITIVNETNTTAVAKIKFIYALYRLNNIEIENNTRRLRTDITICKTANQIGLNCAYSLQCARCKEISRRF